MKFEEYFSNGMNVAEASKSHQDYLELATEANLEATLANAAVNPKSKTIQWWYDEWRKLNLGGRTGEHMLDVRLQ